MRVDSADVLLVDIPEAARRVGMSVRWIQAKVYAGEIASIKLGKSRRIEVDELRAYVARLKAERDEDQPENDEAVAGHQSATASKARTNGAYPKKT